MPWQTATIKSIDKLRGFTGASDRVHLVVVFTGDKGETLEEDMFIPAHDFSIDELQKRLDMKAAEMSKQDDAIATVSASDVFAIKPIVVGEPPVADEPAVEEPLK